ncbi:MAG: OmpA family protein [Bacteroidota bacterium]
MTRSINLFLISSLMVGVLFMSVGCRTTEEVTEPEVEQEEPEEELDDEVGFVEEEPEPEPDHIEELTSVNFNFDKSDITDRASRMLADNVQQLRDNPDVRVRVDAYTDHVGGDQYNVRLSVRRAESVANFYRTNGISSDRIETRGLGKHPVPCTEEEADDGGPGCEKNRVADSHPINPSY